MNEDVIGKTGKRQKQNRLNGRIANNNEIIENRIQSNIKIDNILDKTGSGLTGFSLGRKIDDLIKEKNKCG